MSFNVLFANFSKRINSTKQPVEDAMLSISVVLKDGCSEDSPVFVINRPNNSFIYNYCKWGDRYYWVTDVEYTRNNLFTVSCSIDVLATYKYDILNTTAYVSYSSVSGGAWLADTRLTVKKDCIVSKSEASLNIFRDDGFYILSVLGENGCVTYLLSLHQLKAMLDDIQSWKNQTFQKIMTGKTFTSIEEAIQSFSEISLSSDLLGNAYSNIPACIRSCIWVPFANPSPELESQTIFLGNFETGVTGTVISGRPYTGQVSISIPWHFSDWRRGYCEDVYLYLPLVGNISLSSDSLTGASSITIKYSYTMTDGTIAYELVSGNEIIGTYGGSCAANYPIGINQQASAGEIMNSVISGIDKVVSAGVNAGMNMVSAGVGMAAEALTMGYDVANVGYSTHPTCIGGVGGGSGAGLGLNAVCYTVAHSTVIEPSQMLSTMGLPTMKPIALSSCSGYCQCANAHVSASAHREEIAAIDNFINSGFYIE